MLLWAKVFLSPSRTVEAIIDAFVVEYFKERGVRDWSKLFKE
jgi:hypothetical protein